MNKYLLNYVWLLKNYKVLMCLKNFRCEYSDGVRTDRLHSAAMFQPMWSKQKDRGFRVWQQGATEPQQHGGTGIATLLNHNNTQMIEMKKNGNVEL